MKQDEILLAFVQGADGEAWARRMYGWRLGLPGVTVCDWSGVDCENVNDEGEGAVTSVNLSQTGLMGTIPPQLGMLTSLKKLDVSQNMLMGSIPLDVARLPNLEEVKLSKNQLNGSLPNFASEQLQVLDVEANKLTEKLPEAIGDDHPMMLNLNLVNNEFIGTLPESITKMKNLVWLQLSQNHFFGALPDSLGELYNLQYLYLDHNNFVGEIPRSLTPASSRLTEVWLHRNTFSGTVPSAFAELRELKNLYVDGNKFTGFLPQDLCKPQINEDFFEDNVDEKDRNYCESIACPAETYSTEGVWPCNACQSDQRNPFLGLEGNNCFSLDQGAILAAFYAALEGGNWDPSWQNFNGNSQDACNLSGVTCDAAQQVTRLELPGRGLKGRIIPDLGFLEHLERLNLADNELAGFLPSDLMFAPLRQLDISGNRLIGVVPPKLCQKHLNGNGAGGIYECDLVACPENTYSNTGIANDRRCLPCNDGRPFIGKKTCSGSEEMLTSRGASSSSSSSSSSQGPSGAAGAVIGVVALLTVLGLMAAAGYMLYVRQRRRESKSAPELGEFDVSYDVAPYQGPELDYHHDQLVGSGGGDLAFPGSGVVEIEEMDDDDYSSITRVKKYKKKKKKRSKNGTGSSRSAGGMYDTISGASGSMDDEEESGGPQVWLDVPKLELQRGDDSEGHPSMT